MKLQAIEITLNPGDGLDAGRELFSSSFVSALGAPGSRFVWNFSKSGRGVELWDGKQPIKVARFVPHAISVRVPELDLFFPIRAPEVEKFGDTVLLTAMAILVNARGAFKVIGGMSHLLSGPGSYSGVLYSLLDKEVR